jgi:hypothetical protein
VTTTITTQKQQEMQPLAPSKELVALPLIYFDDPTHFFRGQHNEQA